MAIDTDRGLARLRDVMDRDAVAEATSAPAWAIHDRAPVCVVTPRTEEQVITAVRVCAEERLALVPWGGGTRIHVGAAPRAYDVALSLARLDRIVRCDPADLTLTAEAGATLASINARAREAGQVFPLDVPFPARATIGGALAGGTDGPRTGVLGGLRALINGTAYVTGAGVAAQAGGRVVKNVTGYDVHRLLVRSYGALAVLTRVHLRLAPAPEVRATWAVRTDTRAVAERAAEALRLTGQRPSAVVVLSPEHAATIIPPVEENAPATSLFASTGTAASADAWWVLCAWDGSAEDVTAACSEAGSAIRAHAADRIEVPASAAESVWARAAAALVGRVDGLLCLVTVPPAAGALVLGPLARACEHAGAPARIAWQADRGTIALRCATAPPAGCAPLVYELRAIARGSGGHCVAESLPPAEATPDVVWGPGDASRVLLRRVKNAFDPAAILSPGRLVDGL